MHELLVMYVLACYGGSSHVQVCVEEMQNIQYAFQIKLNNDEIIPYRTMLDKDCSEMPEGCKGLEAAHALGEMLRKRSY